MKRIIPVSSGKGGVGKTTFALNFALSLSRTARVTLVDLDTGTSSVRNAIDVPVEKDLYHFFKKNESLESCVTRLDARLDPDGEFRNFGFVAAPKHMIEEITNFGADKKQKVSAAINSLDTDYVILDLKAGLDSNVMDFLPYSNSGILVFTPHMQAATLAASDIVKAILFRKLRLIFSEQSPFYEAFGNDRRRFFRLTNDLIDQAEDVYDESIPNLEGFVVDLEDSLGMDHPITRTVINAVHFFKVHYVLNLFNGVESSYETAVRPFVENLTENVTNRLFMTNLGWITKSRTIEESYRERVPALLRRERPRSEGRSMDRIEAELEDLRVTAIGLEPRRPPKKRPGHVRPTNDPGDFLDQQLETLKAMVTHRKEDDFRANFEYLTQRALFTMENRRAYEFGDSRLFSPSEMLQEIYRRASR